MQKWFQITSDDFELLIIMFLQSRSRIPAVVSNIHFFKLIAILLENRHSYFSLPVYADILVIKTFKTDKQLGIIASAEIEGFGSKTTSTFGQADRFFHQTLQLLQKTSRFFCIHTKYRCIVFMQKCCSLCSCLTCHISYKLNKAAVSL